MTTATAQLGTSPQCQDIASLLRLAEAAGTGWAARCHRQGCVRVSAGARAQQQPSETQSGAASSRLGSGLPGEEAAGVRARALPALPGL